MKDKTIDFFLHAECQQSGGKWDESKGVCDCGEGMLMIRMKFGIV